MFQEGQAAKSDQLMRGVVRKNPMFAGLCGLPEAHCAILV